MGGKRKPDIFDLAGKGVCLFFTLPASLLCAFLVLPGVTVSFKVLAQPITGLEMASPNAPLGSQPVLT